MAISPCRSTQTLTAPERSTKTWEARVCSRMRNAPGLITTGAPVRRSSSRTGGASASQKLVISISPPHRDRIRAGVTQDRGRRVQ